MTMLSRLLSCLFRMAASISHLHQPREEWITWRFLSCSNRDVPTTGRQNLSSRGLCGDGSDRTTVHPIARQHFPSRTSVPDLVTHCLVVSKFPVAKASSVSRVMNGHRRPRRAVAQFVLGVSLAGHAGKVHQVCGGVCLPGATYIARVPHCSLLPPQNLEPT